MFRQPAVRSLASLSTRNVTRSVGPRFLAPVASVPSQQVQMRQQHAVSNPTLANIEKRWEAMPPQEQAELWMALRDRMTVDWHELTMQEKKASYWIAFGPHGPRSQTDPKEKWQILRVIFLCIAASAAIFFTARGLGGKPPKTMNKEWQEMTNEYLKAQKSEAITGVSSEGYQGPGMVQSPPSGKKASDLNEED